jgi:hypothetical protein
MSSKRFLELLSQNTASCKWASFCTSALQVREMKNEIKVAARVFAVTLVATGIVAQQTKPKIEFCGLGKGSHECSCIRRVQKIHEKAYDECERSTMRADGSKDQKEWEACIGQIPTHCDIAESVTGHDELNPGFEGYWDPEKAELNSDAFKMGPLCTMACKMHDCKCDDGPTCHFGHTAADHEAKQ